MNTTLIVMPTYNERENLPRIVQRLLSLPVKVDLLVVDDNSPDGTGKLADELAAKHPEVHVLHRSEKNGLGRAYLAGFKWALERDYEFVFEMDGDFSHNPDDVPAFLDAAKDADVVLGFALHQWHPHHQLAVEPPHFKQGRGSLRQDHHRHADHGSDGWLQMFPATRAAGLEPRCGAIQRLQLSS